jgi:hypothetical protein
VSTAEGPESERKRFALTISTGGLSGIMGLRGDIKRFRLVDLLCYVLIQLMNESTLAIGWHPAMGEFARVPYNVLIITARLPRTTLFALSHWSQMNTRARADYPAELIRCSIIFSR